MKQIFFILIVFLYACNTNKSKEEIVNSVQRFNLSHKNEHIVSNLTDSVSFLPLKEKDDFLFSTINKLIIKENQIYVLDIWSANSLYVFDDSGVFIRKVGNKGIGPKEYVRLWDFDVDSSYIYLYDRAKMQIQKYDLQGNFIEEKKTPFRLDGFKVLENQKYLFSLAKEDNHYQVLLTDSTFHVESSFFPFEKKYLDNKMTDNVFQEYEGTIFYNKLINDTIYSFSKKGEFLGGVLFDFGTCKVPEKFRNDYDELTKMRKQKKFIYFFDTPIKVNNYWIGKVFNGQNKATFLYNISANEYYIYDWVPQKIDYTDLCMPLFANKNYIVGLLNLEIYNSLRKKPFLDTTIVEYLEEGGHLLCFYHNHMKHL